MSNLSKETMYSELLKAVAFADNPKDFQPYILYLLEQMGEFPDVCNDCRAKEKIPFEEAMNT
jgi:hypothetical protein